MMKAACALVFILASFVPANEAFVGVTGRSRLALPRRGHGYGTPMGDLRTGRSLDVVRHAGLVRPRSVALRASDDDIDSLFGDSLNDNQEGGRAGWEEDSVEAEDVADLSNEFYSEVAARWNTTVEGAIKAEKDLQFDRSLYDELRARRDFGFEQDLGLEFERRNMSKGAEVAKIVDEGLDAMPGMSSSTTVMPSPDLTPREVINSVLEALKNNDHPYHNHGVEVFIRFLSPSSAMHGVEMQGVARYLAENRNRAFMHWDTIAYPRPLTLSGKNKNKAFQPLKLKDTMTGSWHPVSVYLTLESKTNNWLIESIIMKGDL